MVCHPHNRSAHIAASCACSFSHVELGSQVPGACIMQGIYRHRVYCSAAVPAVTRVVSSGHVNVQVNILTKVRGSCGIAPT